VGHYDENGWMVYDQAVEYKRQVWYFRNFNLRL